MGILRRLPAGLGVRPAAEEDLGSAALATIELPGTVAASRLPEAARNCLRSIGKLEGNEFEGDELTGDAVLSGEFLGHESWGRDVMRVTSANATMETKQTIILRHYTTVCGVNKHGKIDFLGETRRGEEESPEGGNIDSAPLEVAEGGNGDGDSERSLGGLLAALEGIHEHFDGLAGVWRDKDRCRKKAGGDPGLTGLGQAVATQERQAEPALLLDVIGQFFKGFTRADSHRIVLGSDEVYSCLARGGELEP